MRQLPHTARHHVTWLAIGLAAAACFSTRSARAQELGREGNLVFGAERLAGFHLGQRTVEAGPVEFDIDFSGLSILWDRPLTPLHQPRITLDFLITDAFSLGGGIGFFSQDVNDAGDDLDRSGVTFLLRAGYALRLSHSIHFWPRGGFVYYSIDTDFFGGDVSLLALELEGMFSFAPADSWAFLVGPAVDLGLSGEAGNDDMTEYSFGIAASIIGWVGL